MFKKIVLLALLMIPVYSFAQEKFAYFNYNETVQLMPEYTQLMDTIQRSNTEFQEEMNLLAEDYEKKYLAFVEQQETLPEAIKIRRQQEIQDLNQKMASFQQQAQQRQELLAQKLMAEINEKLQKIVQQISEENGFTYVIDANNLWYTSPRATDATPLVKKKLGLQ